MAEVAVLDIGSNSVRMVVFNTSTQPPVKIYNEKTVCALGRDLGTTGLLNATAAKEALNAIHHYKNVIDTDFPSAKILAVGTASLREAGDGAQFVDMVAADTGININVITGTKEAHYAAHGVMMFDNHADGVVADFGGGSLELAHIRNNQPHESISLPLGAYRILSMGERAGEALQLALAPTATTFGNLKNMYAIGGSWRALAKAYKVKTNNQDELQGFTCPAQDMIDFCSEIAPFTAEELMTRFGMEKHHATLAHVAGLALSKALSILNPHYFVVSTAGVRDGVLHEYLSTKPKNR